MVGPRLEPGDLLTIVQVLRLVPVARSTIYQLIASGDLPCHRVSTAESRRGRILIARRDLEAFVATTRQTATRTRPRVNVDDLLQKVRRSG